MAGGTSSSGFHTLIFAVNIVLFTKASLLLEKTFTLFVAINYGLAILLISSKRSHPLITVVFCSHTLPTPRYCHLLEVYPNCKIWLWPYFLILLPYSSTFLFGFHHIYSLKVLISCPYWSCSLSASFRFHSLIYCLWISRSVTSTSVGIPLIFSTPSLLPFLSHPTCWSDSSVFPLVASRQLNAASRSRINVRMSLIIN